MPSVKIRKIKNSCIDSAQNQFNEYCENSTIHGTKYLGEKGRPWIERVCWIVVFCISLYLCGVLIAKLYKKWDETPVIVSFNEKSTPVWQIPFPAITICPETHSVRSRFNYTDVFRRVRDGERLAGEELLNFQALTAVCEADPGVDIGENFTKEDFAWRLHELAPPQNEIFRQCIYRAQHVNCSELFVETLTDFGICYTFNMLAAEEFRIRAEHDPQFNFSHNRSSNGWSLEKGYENDSDFEVYPGRAFGAGIIPGMSLWLSLNKSDFDYVCGAHHQGYRILLHSPEEAPQMNKRPIQTAVYQEAVIAFNAKMFTTSSDLRKYSPEKRQCFFNNERHLQFFKIYTEENCDIECQANFTLQQCGCADFSVPRNGDTPICGGSKSQCVEKSYTDIIFSDFLDECYCLPACTSILYETEIIQNEVPWMQHISNNRPEFDELDFDYDNENYAYSLVNFHFKESGFVSSKRSELYGLTDFIANCGGLLGLFMGVSLLSIIEIIYFCTLRARSNRKKENKTEDSRV